MYVTQDTGVDKVLQIGQYNGQTVKLIVSIMTVLSERLSTPTLDIVTKIGKVDSKGFINLLKTNHNVYCVKTIHI